MSSLRTKYSFSSLTSNIKSSAYFKFSRSLSNATAVENLDESMSEFNACNFNQIFLYLSPSDLLVCGLVNRAWRLLSHLPQLWQRFIIQEEIPIGPQWNYLLERHSDQIGYGWKMIYFQFHRQIQNWRKLCCRQKSMALLEDQPIKCLDGDQECIVIATEIGISVLDRNDLAGNDKSFKCSSPITSICLHHEFLAAAHKSGQITLWNLINLTREASIKQSDSLGFTSLLFMRDIYLIGSALNGNIYIYTFKTNLLNILKYKFRKQSKVIRQTEMELFKVIQGHNSDIFTMIRINNDIFATGSTDHTIKIWDIRNFKCIQLIKGHSLDILCLACNDEYLWTGSMDKMIKKWKICNFELEQTLIGHIDWVKVLLKVPEWLISGGWDETLLFWDNDGDIIKKIDLKLGPISACIADHQKLFMNCKGKDHESEMIILDFS